MSRYHNSIYLGDIKERLRILEEVGQLPLAYASAAVHDMKETADNIQSKMGTEIQTPSLSDNGLLFPPIPIFRGHESNWPLLNVSKGYFDASETRRGEEVVEEKKSSRATFAAMEDLGEAKGWGDDLDDLDDEPKPKPSKNTVDEDEYTEKVVEERSEWDIDDLGLSDDEDTKTAASSKATPNSSAILPTSGPSYTSAWTNSNFAADHVAAGSFESAFKLLNKQIGAVHFEPLKNIFLQLAGSTGSSLPSLANLPSQDVRLCRTQPGPNSLPLLFTSLEPLIDVKLKGAYKSTFGGKFEEALQQFTSILHQLTVVVVQTKKEAAEAKELVNICREHCLGLRMELARKKLGSENIERQSELAAYFTHCKIEPNILRLSLRSAMTQAFKIKNFLFAASFARRLLELDPPEEIEKACRKVIATSEKEPSNALRISYNEKNPFVICGITFTPIYRGTAHVLCPFCSTCFLESKTGEICPTCNISSIGSDASGLLLFQEAKRTQRKAKKVVEEEEEDDDDGWN